MAILMRRTEHLEHLAMGSFRREAQHLLVLSKLLESGQREQGVLSCRGQILQVDHGRQVLGQGE
jgi:hypothetical protein